MPRPRKKKIDEVPIAEGTNALLNVLDEDGLSEDMTDADIQKWLQKNRKTRLKQLLALAKSATDNKTKLSILLHMDAMDLGKPSSKKRDETEGIGVVIMPQGQYGIR